MNVPDISSASWDGNVFPASPAQERMWFLEHLHQGQADHHIPWVMRLEGAIDSERLRVAVAAVVARHEALRTRFVSRDGVLLQIVDSHSPVELTIEELATSESARRDRRALERLEQEAACPFDLTQGPLVRALLLRLGDTEHVLMLTLHH